MDWSPADVRAMTVALDVARHAGDEVPVGAVVVIDREIVATAHNQSIRKSDPCGHAEIVALRIAADRRQNYRLESSTLFVTLEPCVMCVGAIAAARVQRVVFGAYDEKSGALGSAVDLSDTTALQHRFEVNGGLLQDESKSLLQNFFRRRR